MLRIAIIAAGVVAGAIFGVGSCVLIYFFVAPLFFIGPNTPAYVFVLCWLYSCLLVPLSAVGGGYLGARLTRDWR
jgi:hypothetical protein